MALLLAATYAIASPANPRPRKVAQPNGDTITIRLIGDEYGSCHKSIDGYIIERDTNGYWRYVTAIVNDTILVTGVVSDSGPTAPIDQQQVREQLSLSRQRTKAKLLHLDDGNPKHPPLTNTQKTKHPKDKKKQ